MILLKERKPLNTYILNEQPKELLKIVFEIHCNTYLKQFSTNLIYFVHLKLSKLDFSLTFYQLSISIVSNITMFHSTTHQELVTGFYFDRK